MTIGSLYIRPMGILVMLVPFVLAILAVWLRSVRVTKDTAGYVSNATRFGYWLLVITVMSVIITLIAGFFDSQLSFFHNNGLWFLVLLSFLFFLCYYVIAFKPATADQLKEAKENGSMLYETAGIATAGLAGGAMMMLKSTLMMLAQAPIEIVQRSGGTIWYRMASVSGTLGGVAVAIIPIIVVGLLLAFFAIYFLLFIVVLSWLLVVIKFLKNLIYLNGPRS